MKTLYDFTDNSIITRKYEYIFLCISLLLGLVDHKILKFITENFGMQTRSHFLLMCDLKKKIKKLKINKLGTAKPGLGSGRVGSGRGRGWGGGRGRPACTRVGAKAPICLTAATFKPFFSRPPLSGAPRRTSVVDAARNFLFLLLSTSFFETLPSL